MAPFRPRPHNPVPGSVRPQDARRLVRLRARLARRWQRRQKRQLAYFVVACAALAGAIALSTHALSSSAWGKTWAALEVAGVVTGLAGVLTLAMYALWRSDRIRRRARSARIRLQHVERRIAAFRQSEES
jgi:hypothetical protein